MLSAFADGTLFGERFGDAPMAVLALHGWGRSHKDFDQVLGGDDPLDAIALDLPGFGATPPPSVPFSSKDYAESISSVLNEAERPVIVVGHSHGGRVAVELATLYPERIRALVLVAAPILRRSDIKKPSFAYRAVRFLHKAHLISDERFEARRKRSGSADYNAAQGVMRETLVKVINESFVDELARMACPVVLVWGSDDTDVPLEIALRAQALIGSSSPVGTQSTVALEVLDGVGHLVPTTAPGALRTAIEGMAS